MNSQRFIARRLRFKGGLALFAIALSFLVIIIAVAVSAGFRKELRGAVAGVAGDLQVQSTRPVSGISEVEGVESVREVIYQTGIVKSGDLIQGILLKADGTDTVSLGVRIPERLSRLMGLGVGDPMLCYFVGDVNVKLRKFTVLSIYDSPIVADDQILVYANADDLRRVALMAADECSCIEIGLEAQLRSDASISEMKGLLGTMLYPLVVESSLDKYPQLFDWLGLIDMNVLAIILLMSVVAGFNMISGLLILLFRSVSTIGTLKAMGMDNRRIAGVFLRLSARLAAIGMFLGNALALLFCVVQDKTHLLKLDPVNYFVSFVPVEVNWAGVMLADIFAFVFIMILLLIPTLFISKVDPSRTVRAA